MKWNSIGFHWSFYRHPSWKHKAESTSKDLPFGYTCLQMLAVAYALASNRPLEECKSAATSLGATLRAQVSSHLRKYNHFRDGWAPDRRWTETTEGGTIPRKYNDWVEATARPSRWICGPTLSIGKPVKPLHHCHYFWIMVTIPLLCLTQHLSQMHGTDLWMLFGAQEATEVELYKNS